MSVGRLNYRTLLQLL